MTARSRPRLSKYGREVAPIAERCGYEFERQAGGHYVFTQPGFENFVVPSTPSDSRAFANDLAELKRRHPEQFRRAKSENRPSKHQRRERAKRRLARPPISHLPLASNNGAAPDEPIVSIHPPGSDEAVASGCTCPVYENHHGFGIEDQPGVFAYHVGCPYHTDEHLPPQQAASAPRCACGNKLPHRRAGRPRKWCFACRPSRWDQATEEERERARESVRRWYSTHIKEEAA